MNAAARAARRHEARLSRGAAHPTPTPRRQRHPGAPGLQALPSAPTPADDRDEARVDGAGPDLDPSGPLTQAVAVTRCHGATTGRGCFRCGRPLPGGATARRRFCSDACRVAAFREKHGEVQAVRARAHDAVRRAVEGGRMARTACIVCGVTGRVEGHHHNGYGPSAQLDVIFMCSRCHKAAHRRLAS